MLKQIKALVRKEEGVTATEYALIIVVVALAMVAGATILGTDLSTLFTSVGGKI